MSQSEIENWEINIENSASRAATEYGYEVVNSVFARYGASGFHNLASHYYSDVFGDLELIANDL